MSTRDDLDEIWPGTTWTGTFTWLDAAGTPVNVATGYTAAARFGIAGSAALVSLTNTAGITLGSNGTFLVMLTPAQTTLLYGKGIICVDVDATKTSTAAVTPIARGTALIGDRVSNET